MHDPGQPGQYAGSCHPDRRTRTLHRLSAGVTQLVEYLPSKQAVASSSLVPRSTIVFATLPKSGPSLALVMRPVRSPTHPTREHPLVRDLKTTRGGPGGRLSSIAVQPECCIRVFIEPGLPQLLREMPMPLLRRRSLRQSASDHRPGAMFRRSGPRLTVDCSG